MAEQAAAGRPAMMPKVIGRYALYSEIAAGGMATVHIARLVGQVGFSRTVAIKRLHPQYAKDPEFVTMFLDEARLASRVQHPNVVTTLDVVSLPTEVFLVMEYVHGESLSRLVRQARALGEQVPTGHVAAIIAGMLHGLHAAHEAKSEKREPLHIVHRDISPQNVLVGVDGAARVLDFGVAKAALRAQSTRDSQMKGKLGYMSPEQLNAKPVDRRTDLFAAAVVLWEALTGQRLFDGADAGEIFAKVLASPIPDPVTLVPELPDALCRVVMKGLERNPADRYRTAREFATELEAAVPISTARAVGEWVERVGGAELAARTELIAAVEGTTTTSDDLVRMEAEQASLPSAPPAEIPEGSSSISVASGSRPRLPPPPRGTGSRSGITRSPSLPNLPAPPTAPRSAPQVSAPDLPAAPAAPVVAAAPPRVESTPEERSASASKVPSHVAQQAAPAAPLAAGPSPLRTPAWVWAAALAASLGGAGGAYAIFSPARPSSTAPAAPLPTPVPKAAPVPAAAPPAPVVAAPPVETVDVDRLPIDVEETPTLDQKGDTPRRRSGPEVSRGAPIPAVNCDPPFTLDVRGIKRPKPGCL